MRLDIVPENPAEWAAARSGMLPGSVVKVMWGFSMARTLVAAVDLDVFEQLREAPLDAAAVARRLDADEQGILTLLNALNGFGLLKRRGDRYSLRAEARRYLTDEKGTNLGAALRFGVVLDSKMRNLAHTIKTGEREDFHAHLTDEEWDSYLRGLGALGTMTAGEVARKLPLQDPQRILDVAGGHGGFSMALCKRHPGLSCEVLDLPGGVRVGEQLVADAGLTDRITYRSGDLREEPWGDGYGAVLLFNILHNLPEQDAADAVHKAFQAVRPGGLVAILEGQHAGGRGDLSFQEGFGELLFYLLSSSMTWPEPTLRTWMEAAGLVSLKRKGVLTLPGAVLLMGTRPS